MRLGCSRASWPVSCGWARAARIGGRTSRGASLGFGAEARPQCAPMTWRRCVQSGLVALVCGVAASVQAKSLEPCRLKGVVHEALCGSVQRALDPTRPDGTRIDVHFAVLPALARNKLADPVFFIAGGPGQSAIELAGPLAAQFARL